VPGSVVSASPRFQIFNNLIIFSLAFSGIGRKMFSRLLALPCLLFFVLCCPIAEMSFWVEAAFFCDGTISKWTKNQTGQAKNSDPLWERLEDLKRLESGLPPSDDVQGPAPSSDLLKPKLYTGSAISRLSSQRRMDRPHCSRVLWRQHRTSFCDNPLPQLFKEKLDSAFPATVPLRISCSRTGACCINSECRLGT